MPAHQRVSTLILMMVLRAASAGAGDFECVGVIQDTTTMFRRADVVFVGLLKRIQFGDTLVFQVDRVWKGRLGREQTIWQLERRSLDDYRFDVGATYLIFANKLLSEERTHRLDPSDPPAFGIHQTCWIPPPLSAIHDLNKITRARKPRG
jgi:hypothetical protein